MAAQTHFDLVAPNYLKLCQNGLWGHLKSREASALKPLLKMANAGHILDYGCGAGYYTKILKTLHPQAEITGLDVSAPMVDVYQRQGFHGVRGDLSLFPPESFDLILAAGVFEFINGFEASLSALLHCLKRPGRVVFLFPRKNFLNQFYRLHHQRRGTLVHLRTLDRYQHLVEQAGGRLIFTTNPTWISSIQVFEKS